MLAVMDSLFQDVRQGLRSLRRQPGFVAVAAISLALGTGVNTAIFSAVDALLLRPPPLRDVGQSVVVYDSGPGNADQGTSFRAFQNYRERIDVFSDVMAWSGARPLVLTDGPRGDQVYAELVTSSFFSIADITLIRGAPFPIDVDRSADAPLVAILSHKFWIQRFNSDPAIVGGSVTLNGQPFLVTGIAAPGFTGLSAEVSTDLWIPITVWARLVGEPARMTSDEHWVTTIGVLKAGTTIDQAQAAVAVAARALNPPSERRTGVRSASGGLAETPTDALAIAAAAFGVGLVILALACTNVANLLIARAAARQHEMSVRVALGSSRLRLVRLWLAESLVLSLSSAGLGLIVAWWLVGSLVAFRPPTLIGQPDAPALAITFQIDPRVVLFALGLSGLTALLIGLLSGLLGSTTLAMQKMRAHRGADRRFAPGFNPRSGIIALQMALSTILLITCGLFVRSSLAIAHASPGFVAEGVLLLPISSDQAGVKVEKPPGFEQLLVDRVGPLAGVEAATVMDPVPLWFGGNYALYEIENHGRLRIGHSSIAPHYFATLRLPLVAGRDFVASDGPSAPPVAIVNETIARRFWPAGNAIGQRLRARNVDIEIVGIARDAKYVSFAETDQPWLYRPIAQSPTNNLALSLAVRTAGDPALVQDAIEREVKALVPNWPGFQFRTLDEGLQMQRRLPRLGATLLGGLGGFGLFLAVLGMHGVMAYVVRQRRRELGIRVALGASTGRVLALVIGQGLTVCLAGAAAGIALALAVTQLLTSVLYGVGAADPLTYLLVPATLLLVALFAAYLPARHATRVNPSEVLRNE